MLVGVLGKGPVGVLIVGFGRDLQIGDAGGVPHVGLAVSSPVVIAGVGQDRNQVGRARGETQFVAL